MKPALALYQPDIAGNTGTLIRLTACLGTELHIIEPSGFRTDDTALKRAGMDYHDIAAVTRHVDFASFVSWLENKQRRLVLLTTKSPVSYTSVSYTECDVLLLGRESAGVPDCVHARSATRIRIPMLENARSLNQAISGAMVLGEALRQTNCFPT